ncbi:30S ribosome-binding factor RbfA [Treponema brennaborense]|uniref:Ribosome-binding factor A n=1 Tax=Treponema brennaborense (strain DSM 12168 / CIP 105900 / DD5/3) TaxID=906968 RepID=F4LJE2_TREBD|nr:30S ribosome-binding factor RbfA [Treponema brennaborense]AEE17387.1 Ribosome-binding factor A [Treponema brennaborense DSM 12168]
MSSFRLIRLGEQIREEISRMILTRQIKDPRVSTFLSVNRVDVSGDLGYAKVYVSSFMSVKETENGVKGLQNAAGFIQSTIAKKLTIRQFPKLSFILDQSIKEGFEMVRKLNDLELQSQSSQER